MRRLTGIPGVSWDRLIRHADGRGTMREVWRASWFTDLDPALTASESVDFRQANLSTSATGVLRGLHLHRRQLDQWVIVDGRALVALVDARPMLAGGSSPTVELTEAETDDRVIIPVGVAHGFLALEPLTLLYLVTNEYDGTDELGFAWDDPTAAIRWPAVAGTPGGRPILSDRDRANPSLPDLIARLRG
jgi:dTDP-4-dehydrorhamnose 3,5-epimerase